MRTKIVGFLAVGLLLAGQMPTSVAGTILVSGDSNTTDILAYGVNEQLFFSNVLAAGSTVKILDFADPCSGCSVSNTQNEIQAFYSSLGGVTSTIVSGTVTSAVLVGVNLFIAPLPSDNFSAPEVAAFLGFLTGGGTLFVLGENSISVFNGANAAINQLLDDLGSSIDLVPNILSGPGTFTADPFTTGLTGLVFAAGSQVTGGKTLYSSGTGLGLIAREEIGRVSVPEPGTLALFGLGLAGLGLSRRRRAD